MSSLPTPPWATSSVLRLRIGSLATPLLHSGSVTQDLRPAPGPGTETAMGQTTPGLPHGLRGSCPASPLSMFLLVRHRPWEAVGSERANTMASAFQPLPVPAGRDAWSSLTVTAVIAQDAMTVFDA